MKGLYYEKDGIAIWNGETLDVLRFFAETGRYPELDMIATDPPYSSGGQFRGDRNQATGEKYVQTGQVRTYDDFTGDNRDQRAFGFWSSLWLSQALRLCRRGAIAAVFSDWRQVPITTDALQAGGFVWRGLACWDKTEAARPMKGRYRNQCEYVVWGSAGPIDAPDEAPCLPGVWTMSSANQAKQHAAQKPLALMKELLRICRPGGLVLDPFMGSGTTLRAAKDLGLRAIGIEISERYCELAAKRLAQGVLF